MAAPARLYTFTPSTTIQSSQVNGELNQIITALSNINTTGTLRNLTWDGGFLKADSYSDANTRRYLVNCYWSGSAFTAHDTSKPAFSMTFHVGDSSWYIARKDTTTSPWTTWTATIVNINSSNLVAISDLSVTGSVGINLTTSGSSKITHVATTKYLGLVPYSFAPDTGDPANIATGVISAQAADGANDLAHRGFDLPIGAIITQVNLYGVTVAATDVVQMIVSRKDISTSGPSETIANISMSNADSSPKTEASPTNATITQGYGYYVDLRIKSSTATANARFFGAQITYTVANLSQTI